MRPRLWPGVLTSDFYDDSPKVFLSHASEDKERFVEGFARQLRKNGKRGYIPNDIAPILLRLGVDEKEWVRTVIEFNKRFRFAAGALGKLEQWCHAVGRQWIQGRKSAAKLYAQPA